MNDFQFQNSTKVYFGKDQLDHLHEEVLKYGKSVLVVYGGGSIKKIGLYDKVMKELKVDQNGNGQCYPSMGCRSFLTPYIDENGREIIPEEPNSYKFESFIFDSFEFFDDIAILRGKREDDFAPVKNKEGVDSPKTAKELYEKYWERQKREV